MDATANVEDTKYQTPIWNLVSLPPPAVCTVKSKWGKEIRVLNFSLKKIITTLQSLDIMLYETKLLAGVIKKFKYDLRSDKCFILVKKITQCLKKCQLLDLKNIFMNFESTSIQCNVFEYQPSRQMLEYLIVRIQGFITLMKYLIDMCHDCALQLKAKMEIGHFPSVVLTFFSIVSRIWTLSKYFVENALEWYLLLLPSLQFLEPTPCPWLPTNYQFPALPLELKLTPWLDQNKILKSLRTFLSDFQESEGPRTNLQYLTNSDDLGETISRADMIISKPTSLSQASTPLQKNEIAIQKKRDESFVRLSVKNKTVPVQSNTVYVKNKATSVSKNINSEPRKRKLIETESQDSEPEQVIQPVKHFFKRKYSKQTVGQENNHLGREASSEEAKKKTKRLASQSSVLKVDETVKDARSTDILEELARLKEDLSDLTKNSKLKEKPRLPDSGFKNKVIVIEDKKPSILDAQRQKQVKAKSGSEESCLVPNLRSKLCRQTVKIQKNTNLQCKKVTRVKTVPGVSTMNLVKSRSVSSPDDGDAAVSDSRKIRPVLRRLEKKKELLKLRKQKSKSWVIS